MQFKNFTLDSFQEEAIQAIENNQSVVVSAPTGSGKTLIADYIIYKHKDDKKRIIYTAPIKALSNQKYKDFCQEYGADKIGLMTGDIVINPQAKVIIMTTEIYRNMVVSKDSDIEDIAYVIFDEIHYINDIERGYVWEESIIYSAETVRFLCLSATIPNAQEFSDWIAAIKNHPVVTVVSTKRHVPLQHLFYDYELGITSLEEIKKAQEQGRRQKRQKGQKYPAPNHIELIKELGKDKMPCLFFSFSRKDCEVKARELAKRNFFPRDGKIMQLFQEKLRSAPPEINRLDSTRIMKESIAQGIAFHHAGLLPIIKSAVEELFSLGLIKVLYATETFAVGINMPAKTVCFDSLRKFDGFNFRNLNTKEYFQIAGRAGRRGIDTIGYVISMIYRPTFRYEEVKAITFKDTEPIRSQFKLSINTVLNLIDLHSKEEIEHILRLSFFSYQKFGKNFMNIPTKLLLARYENVVKQLTKQGFLAKGELTDKGHFASKIFADEITIGEVFATEVVEGLDEYQILLTLASLVFEPRERQEFKAPHRNDQLKNLIHFFRQHPYLSHEKKFLQLPTITAMIYPIYSGKTFFEVLEESNLLEGDVIRFYAQILDRIGQIKKATTSNYQLLNKMENCRGIIERALEGIYLI